MLGDFNKNLLNYEQDTSTNEFLNSLSSHLFLPHILQPTRVRSNSKTLIDYIFSNAVSGASPLGRGGSRGAMTPHFNFRTKQGPTISVSKIKHIAFYGCSEIIWTKNFTILTAYATSYGQFTAAFHFF